MGKLPTKQIASDDCVVTLDGVEYTPHEGEWIRAVPGLSVAELRLVRELNELKPKLDAIEDEDTEQEQSIALMDHSFGRAVAIVAGRIEEWNWTDNAGQPYPKNPDEEVIRCLQLEELYYLLAAVRGETPAERGNGSRPSQTSTSATKRRQRRA